MPTICNKRTGIMQVRYCGCVHVVSVFITSWFEMVADETFVIL